MQAQAEAPLPTNCVFVCLVAHLAPPCASNRGVFWDRKTGRWRSQLGYHNRKIFMGYFNEPEEAARAYDAKAVELHGPMGKKGGG